MSSVSDKAGGGLLPKAAAASAQELTVCVLATALTPMRRAFLHALLRSLSVMSPKPAPFTVVAIGGADARDVTGRYGVTQLVAPAALLGSKRALEGVNNWCVEQMLALAFPAMASTAFTLVLPIGAFAVRPLDPAVLLPRGRALTTAESMAYHPDWWANARAITRRIPASPNFGPTILPAIISRDLAVWTLNVVGRENGGNPLDVLWNAILAEQAWSAMSLYATASGSRFGQYHVGVEGPNDEQRLLSSQIAWSEGDESSFDPAAARRQNDPGVFTYVQTSALQTCDGILDRLYCSLGLEL